MNRGLKALEIMNATVDVMCSTEYNEAKKIVEKELKALGIIRSHLCGMGGVRGSAEGPNEYVVSLKDLSKEEYAMLEEVIR